jgi:tetratricopeptide (TPR) repeat protein
MIRINMKSFPAFIYFVAAFVLLIGIVAEGEPRLSVTTEIKTSEKKSKTPLTPPEVEELRSKIARRSDDFASRHRLAEHFIAQKDFASAIDVLKPAMDKLPRRGLLLLADAFHGNKDQLNEIRALELLSSKNDTDYYIKFRLSQAYVRNEKYDQAILRLQEAIKINPRFEGAYDALINVYKKTNNSYELRILLEDMKKLFGPKARVLTELCRVYSIDNYIERAFETCFEATRKSPKTADNHVYYSLALKEREGPQKALKAAKRAAKKFPKSEFALWTAGRLSMEEEKNYLAAFKYFQLGTHADPKAVRSYMDMGIAGLEIEKYQEALDAFLMVCNLDRTQLPLIRKHTAKIRHEGAGGWSAKFEAGIGRCSG